MNRKRWMTWTAALALCLVAAGAWAAGVPEKIIEAQGAAAGTDGKAKETATNRALRTAVEQGVGTFVDSNTMVQNYQLLQDRILAEVKGYVKSYEVIADNGGQDGVYRVTVRATVALAVIENDLKALNLVKEMRNNPRLMVIAKETVDGFERDGGVIRSQIEKEFLKRSFQLVDPNQMKMVKERDVALSFENPKEAVALAKRFGAEIMVLAEGKADFGDKAAAYGVPVYTYSADVSARAIKTDTAQVVASESGSATGRDGSKAKAAQTALEDAGKEVSASLLKSVAEGMRSEAFNDTTVEVVVHNISSKGSQTLQKALLDMQGVSNVYERSYIEGNLVLEVKIAGSLFRGFGAALESIKELQVKITRKSQDRIDCDVIELAE